jgi:hypothetical protein
MGPNEGARRGAHHQQVHGRRQVRERAQQALLGQAEEGPAEAAEGVVRSVARGVEAGGRAGAAGRAARRGPHRRARRAAAAGSQHAAVEALRRAGGAARQARRGESAGECSGGNDN